jgi:hypothetical protein
MKPEGSSLWSQGPATGTQRDSGQFSPHPPILFIYIEIFSSQLHLDFPFRFTYQMLLATRSAHLIILALIILIISGKYYKP